MTAVAGFATAYLLQ